MRKSTAVNAALLVTTVVAFGAGGMFALAGRDDHERSGPTAFAVVTGPGGIEGIVRFKQEPCPGCPTPEPGTEAREYRNFPEPVVTVRATIRGLSAGAHGFHIHENGVCEPPSFTTAGGHFDPGPFGNSTPVDANHPYHLGDLPNLSPDTAGSDG